MNPATKKKIKNEGVVTPPLSLAATPGLHFERLYTRVGTSPFDQVSFEARDAVIADPDGTVVFEMKGVKIPKGWSQLATDIVASKYFRKAGVSKNPSGREESVQDLVYRVAHSIRVAGQGQEVFASEASAETFEQELTFLLVNQFGAFNSPVWFNCGLNQEYGITGSGGNYYWIPDLKKIDETTSAYANPQCSACQPYGALINTRKGLIPIGEIVDENMLGLEVYDEKGLTKVVAVKRNGRKQVYRIYLKNGITIEATGDHVICATDDRRQSEQWLPVDSLKTGMKMRLFPHQTPEYEVGDDDSLKVSEAALAGWLQSDGFVGQYMTGTNQSLTVEFMTVNEDEHNWVMAHIQKCFPEAHYKVRSVQTSNPQLDCKRIRLYGQHLHNFVESYGLLNRGLDIVVPASIWHSSRAAKVAYLRGLFQAEGYVTIHDDEESGWQNARIGVATISEQWMRDVQLLLMQMGIYSRLTRKKEARANRYDTHVVDISYSNERENFEKIIGFISKEKQEKLSATLALKGKQCPDLREETITAIKPIGEMEVYDIQTESGHYLTNHVLVHNCFIQSVSDDLMSLFDLARNEAKLFKYGSGTGTNFSKIRGHQEKLSGGGTSSGLMSFLEVLDKGAGATKSGGTTRRAAKMVVLDVDHPEIIDFINWKAKEEKKAKVLIDAGYPSDFNGEAYHTVSGQNSNNSVRVTDDFMNAVLRGDKWQTTLRTTGEVCETFDAKWMMRQICEAAWACADPGIQFDTTINDWHTSANTDRIHASNPCSEYVFLDNSACNLASLNLTKFVDANGKFLIEAYRHACKVFITAQEILVDFSSYPTAQIAQNSHDYRPLGLGFANLGTLLMCWGIPYDSDKGRAIAGALMSIMCGHAYKVSAEIAGSVGAFPGFEKNREPMLRVMRKHQEAANKIDARACPTDLFKAAQEDWEQAVTLGEKNGYRNAQTTVLAPTGTIGLLMDCDTTGVEPEFSLVKWKKLAGGGTFKIVNQSVPLALQRLGYDSPEIEQINKYILEKGTIEGASSLKDEHLPIFDCANRGGDGVRFIEPMGHVRMMGAVQPFISGAISKTVNLPNEVTVDDIERIYTESWRLGLKAVALYRDGCKHSQPLNTSKKTEKAVVQELERGDRRSLPQMRKGFTLESSIRGHKLFLRTGEYADGQLGEIFIDMYKEGAAYRSIINCLAIAVSIGLQYGVPLEKYVNSFTFTRFDPQGMADHPNIKMCTSLVDFVFRVLGMHYLGRTDFVHLKPNTVDEIPTNGHHEPEKLSGPGDASVSLPISEKQEEMDAALAEMMGDAPICDICGHVTVRNGSCYKCLSCGNSMGCS